MVRIAGWMIGSLPSEIALMFKEALLQNGYAAGMCAAKIVEAEESEPHAEAQALCKTTSSLRRRGVCRAEYRCL